MLNMIKRLVFAGIVCSWMAASCSAYEFEGKVVSVKSCGEFEVQRRKKIETVVLNGLKCPSEESGWRHKAADKVSGMLYLKNVLVKVTDIKRDGLKFADIKNEKSEDLAVVIAGAGWADTDAEAGTVIALARDKARKEQKGMWASKEEKREAHSGQAKPAGPTGFDKAAEFVADKTASIILALKRAGNSFKDKYLSGKSSDSKKTE